MNLTIKQASERLDVHRNTIGRMRIDGRLEGVKQSAVKQGRVLITEESVAALEKLQAAESGQKVAG